MVEMTRGLTTLKSLVSLRNDENHGDRHAGTVQVGFRPGDVESRRERFQKLTRAVVDKPRAESQHQHIDENDIPTIEFFLLSHNVKLPRLRNIPLTYQEAGGI